MTGFVLRVVEGADVGRSISVHGPLVVGREGDVALRDPAVSRRHLELDPKDDRIAVRDLRSASGTWLNDVSISAADARPGDDLAIGNTRVRVLRHFRYPEVALGHSITLSEAGRARTVAVGDGTVVGRDPSCDVRIEDPSVSRRHATFVVEGGEVSIDDDRSANGTYVGGQAVSGRWRLSDGDEITFGNAPARAVYHHADGLDAPIEVRVGAEDGPRAETMRVEATGDATVAQVTAELATTLQLSDASYLLYRVDDGCVFHPDDLWRSIEPRAGDEYVLGIGDATTLEAGPARLRPSRSGRTLNQLPRTVWPEPPFAVPRLDPPESMSFRGRGVMWQIAGGLGAVVIGLTLAIVNPSYAVFGLITGGIGIVSITASILGEQSRRRHRVSEFRRRLRQLDVDLGDAIARQSASLASLSPTVAEMEHWLRQSSPRIWERRPADPDALTPTIGVGTKAARVTTHETSSPSDSPYLADLDAVVARHARLDGVPVTGPGPRAGTFGVVGGSTAVPGLLARIVVEAAVLHAPGQLRIWVAASRREWEWCRWLPHVDPGQLSTSPERAADVIGEATRAIESSEPSDDTIHLVVVPEAPRHFDLGIAGRHAGRALWVVGADDRRDLPSGLSCVLEVDGQGVGEIIGSYAEAPVGRVTVDGLGMARAGELAVMLGRLAGARSASAPTGVVELLGAGTATSPDVIGTWRGPTRERLTVAVGSDDAGNPVTIGFRRDGPHGMVAGTTGSGKSELLQTMMAALALCHTPEQLTLFLVDFKGGSTFAPLARLPHVVGVVTDIEHDGALAARALTALDAEIDRRKRRLEAARVPDVIAYERTAGDDAEPIPDLLVVIDEFALLVERQPDVRDRLDTIATQGRSLGIHLLLATQSPSGVISHAIRTNTNLWVCLRVVADSESVEILGRRDAARIPDGSPGRAIIRLGAGEELRQFQAARIARPVRDNDVGVRITPLDGTRSRAVESFGTRTELDVVVDRICDAAAELGLDQAAPLWLPPLPTELERSSVAAPRPSDRLVTMIGLADLPRQQAQEPHIVDLSSSGHHLVAGVYGSGKSTTLCQIAVDLADHNAPSDVHIYGLDAGDGSLSPLMVLPHVGDVVGATDVERVTRLIDRLVDEVARRRDQLAASGTGAFSRWRGAGARVPWIVLLVDDYPAFREVAEQDPAGRLLERFNSLLQHGPAAGVHLVIATTQAVDLRAREINLIQSRLVLRSADAADYALVEGRFSPTEVPAFPPGRGLVAHAVEVQVCRLDPADLGSIARRWGTLSDSAADLPREVLRLPATVDPRCLSRAEGIVVGVGGPEVEPVSVGHDPAGLLMLVAGPRQSGRSSTLERLIAAVRPRHLVVIAPRPGPLRHLTGDAVGAASANETDVVVHAATSDLDQVLDDFIDRAGPGSCLVIDDAELLSSASGFGPRMERIVREAAETGVCVLVGARVNDLPAMFDPWARYIVSLRQAVLLQPTSDDAFLFGAKLPKVPPPMVPGRGVLIDRDQISVVQIARCET